MHHVLVCRVDLNNVARLSGGLLQRRLSWTAVVNFPLGFPEKAALLADFGVSTTIPEGETHLTELCGTKVSRPNFYR